jgi:hypothetical protein
MPGRTLRVYLEITPKKTFAGAVDWPGWERSGKTPDDALAAFRAYRTRYAKAVGRGPAAGVPSPDAVEELDVVERRDGGSGTEFGVPSYGASADEERVAPKELERLQAILEGAWRAFDRAAEAAEGVTLATGPRGGGRDLAKMTAHVLEAEEAYVRELGAAARDLPRGVEGADRMAAVRDVGKRLLGERVGGFEPEPGPRRTRPFWTPRYYVRRSAWHALDHAWEIEDRAGG